MTRTTLTDPRELPHAARHRSRCGRAQLGSAGVCYLTITRRRPRNARAQCLRAAALLGAALALVGCVKSGTPPRAQAATKSPAAAEPADRNELGAAPVAIPHAAQPLPQVLTGGQPNAAQLAQAKQAGYRTVISLLPEAENRDEASQVEALGMRFVSIPIAGAPDITLDNARKLSDAMRAPDALPLILHCASGNRAGALLALKLHAVDGLPADEALAIGTRGGMTTLRPAVEARFAAERGTDGR